MNPTVNPINTTNNAFDPHYPRVRKALLGHYRRQLFALGLVVAIILIAIAVALLIARNPLGWLPATFSSPFFMLAIWASVDLRHCPPGKSDNINDLLSAEVIFVLSRHATPADAATSLVQDTVSGRFFATRFGISPDLVTHAAAQRDFAPIFALARQIATTTASSQISGAVLITAIIASAPDGEGLLRRQQLELPDLYNGITWYNFLCTAATDFYHRNNSGGIARDLNFGYIPTLQHFGQNISERASRATRSQITRTARKEALDKMLQIFSSNANQNVALIGPEGCGKSIIVEAFASCLLDDSIKLPSNIRYRQVFKLDAAALISAAGGTRGNIETLLGKLFNEAYAAKNIIIYLNNAQLFFKDGTGSLDLTNLLQPVIEAGRLRLILSIEEQDFLRISARNSGLANSLNRVFVQPTDARDTMNVMEDQVPYFEQRFHVIYDYRALKEAYRLGERYVADRAMPGRALRLLELGAEYAEQGLVTAISVQQAVEHSLGVKVQVATGDSDREKLLDLERLIHARMVGQDQAVETVAGALRRAAAGVRNSKRPIGCFLFMGPTGVGKTELAKTISDVYFGGEGNLVRLDMNEFASRDAVDRLIADAADDPESLTAQITKKPFSVVLLDEIEKAHPSVQAALLQMLDEGQLRDIKNREVSFRDAIIVATTNAQKDDFKPEFINRFDEICVFSPLDKSEVTQIIDLVLANTNRNLAPQQIRVELTPAAKALLVEKGYDPVYGARPLRRIVEKTVENIVAKSILRGSATPGSVIHIDADQLSAELGA